LHLDHRKHVRRLARVEEEGRTFGVDEAQEPGPTACCLKALRGHRGLSASALQRRAGPGLSVAGPASQSAPPVVRPHAVEAFPTRVGKPEQGGWRQLEEVAQGGPHTT
jgi:hypothetical protein